MWLKLLYQIWLVIGCIFSWGTVILYIATQRGWWRSEMAKIVITMSSVVGAFFIWYLLFNFFPNLPGREAIRFGLFTLLDISIIYRFFAFIKLNKIIKRERELKNERIAQLVKERQSDA